MQEAKQNKLALLQQMIDNAERNIVAAKQIMKELNSDPRRAPKDSEASQIVEGTFDGEKMISMEGKIYPVPANYASKSKLVEGDLLKLTITEDGSFVYKKISSVDTRKVIGTVMRDGKEKYYVNAEGRKYNVLLASLTYFKAREGDEVILVVPKEKVSTWAAVESIISEEDRAEMLAQETEAEQIPGQRNMFVPQQEDAAPENHADNPVALEEKQRNAAIEEEWTPDVEEIKKEGTIGKPAADDISDDFSN